MRYETRDPIEAERIQKTKGIVPKIVGNKGTAELFIFELPEIESKPKSFDQIISEPKIEEVIKEEPKKKTIETKRGRPRRK